MKIAITSQGRDLDSQVDPRFGRAAGFIIYDTESKSFDYAGNEQNLSLPQGAGIQSAQNVAGTKVEAVLTGHMGPKAFKALNQGKIKVYLGASGTVNEALDAFGKGEYKLADDADKEGHW